MSIKRVYEAPSLSITGLQLTHSSEMMLVMTRKKKGDVDADADVEVGCFAFVSCFFPEHG
jgi:hypothetical protein